MQEIYFDMCLYAFSITWNGYATLCSLLDFFCEIELITQRLFAIFDHLQFLNVLKTTNTILKDMSS